MRDPEESDRCCMDCDRPIAFGRRCLDHRVRADMETMRPEIEHQSNGYLALAEQLVPVFRRMLDKQGHLLNPVAVATAALPDRTPADVMMVAILAQVKMGLR